MNELTPSTKEEIEKEAQAYVDEMFPGNNPHRDRIYFTHLAIATRYASQLEEKEKHIDEIENDNINLEVELSYEIDRAKEWADDYFKLNEQFNELMEIANRLDRALRYSDKYHSEPLFYDAEEERNTIKVWKDFEDFKKRMG